MPGYKTIGVWCSDNAGEGSDQLAFADARRNGGGYLGGGVRCAGRGNKGSSLFEASAGVYGTVDVGNEGAIKLATNKHSSRRTKHIGVKHHLVRTACDAGKVRRPARGLVNQTVGHEEVS